MDERDRIFDPFRRWGYFQADLDPLGYLQPQPHPELNADSSELAAEAKRIYCGSIGVECMHLPDPEQRAWVAQRMESDPPAPDRQRILELLARATIFEQHVHARYPGTKRFSLEGMTAAIPALDAALEQSAELGAEQCILGMTHRGRLNVMVHIVRRPVADVLARFEDVDPRSVLGSGDVKYHLGATGEYVTQSGHTIGIHLVSNPSHLEAVDPVAMGRARAKQVRMGETGPAAILPILLHGEAAFAGQGVASESLNLGGIEGYSVGGTVHLILNNLVGFTSNPNELHSSRFASDVAKRLPIPIFHVNAEDPEAVVRVARMAAEYRYEFGNDVVVDLIGYRRYGHSEVDDPTITQPVRYRRIQETPALWESYARAMGVDTAEITERLHSEYEAAQTKARAVRKTPVLRELPPYWAPYKGGCYNDSYERDTGIPLETLRSLAESLVSYPDGFSIHPKVKRLLEQRAEMGRGARPVDFGMAEALAFGSLLRDGVPVRLSGEDSRRGTFNQRHAVLIDTQTEAEYIPLCHVSPQQARFEVYNSPLSEMGVLGFEYGYSRDYPEALVLWESQFGDFANGAQVIIDQFIASGEDKWGLLSGVTLLLPHGHEGQGPEHSSARIERYLQLSARDNLQVCQPSTASQYFHLLRRQALRPWRKPLVVFTPKGMLRHADAASPLEDFSAPRFLKVLPEQRFTEATRLLICTGKIVHELRMERTRRKDESTAIVALDQLYPFPEAEIAAELSRLRSVREIVWVQEEPANTGALFYVVPRLKRLARGRAVRSVKRSASATPATGSAKAHEHEQKTLLALAFTSATNFSSAA
ncbi:MAG: 2-oxoglutarate dehydrogenase E1 component [Acidobacteria bacterium]|nr:2-oxoglutarate dehydrogenase E1 component [Acidobacteriota bacterium]